MWNHIHPMSSLPWFHVRLSNPYGCQDYNDYWFLPLRDLGAGVKLLLMGRGNPIISRFESMLDRCARYKCVLLIGSPRDLLADVIIIIIIMTTMMTMKMIMSGMTTTDRKWKCFQDTRRCSVESLLSCVGTGTPFLADPLCWKSFFCQSLL